MIILEGPDNSGKSTLGKKLAKKFDLVLRHSIRPDKSLVTHEVLKHSRDQLIPSRVIQDRVYAISEYVYGTIIRGKTALGPFHAQALRDLYSRDHLIIYCRPSKKTILNNKGRDQMEGVLDNHEAIIDEYDEVVVDINRYSNNWVITYDWEVMPFDYIVERVAAHLSMMDSRESSIQYLTEFKHAEPQEG